MSGRMKKRLTYYSVLSQVVVCSVRMYWKKASDEDGEVRYIAPQNVKCGLLEGAASAGERCKSSYGGFVSMFDQPRNCGIVNVFVQVFEYRYDDLVDGKASVHSC